MRLTLAILTIILSINVRAQLSTITYEWFSLAGGFMYSVEDQYTGLNGKINLPLGSHAKFVMQATAFPEQLQNPLTPHNEIRAKFNVEFIPIKFKKMYLSVQTGFDYGAWQRNYEVLNSTIGTDWKRDESMMFGAVLNYDFHRFRLYADYMYMPEIYSNHVGIGITMLFFESKLYRRMYMQRRDANSNKFWRVREKGKRSKKSKSSNKS